MVFSTQNKLILGDNLYVLEHYMPACSVDLAYLDPPFNSNNDYMLPSCSRNLRNGAELPAFKDKWKWSEPCEKSMEEISVKHTERIRPAVMALHTLLGNSSTMAYLLMMTPRLVALRRVLKPNASLYLHCDPRSSHYMKVILDVVFGANNFVNEIIWHYRKWTNGKYAFQKNHDVILFYENAGGTRRRFNQLFMERAASTNKRFGRAAIVSGYHKNGRRKPSLMKDEDSRGVRQDDVWEFNRVAPIKQTYPTEKPLPLLERIIHASSNAGDVVLDPFCGSGTTLLACQRLGRCWIGIDSSETALNTANMRLNGEGMPAMRSFERIRFVNGRTVSMNETIAGVA